MEASAVASPSEAQTITVEMTPQEHEALRTLSAERNLAPEVVLREALLEKQFFAEHRKYGNKVVFQHPDGKLSPIHWAY